MSTAVIAKKRTPVRPARILLHTFLVLTSLAWLAPLLWAVFAALRP
ncbi:carbohydrate ABC transporter permease, partial [Streptomyces sp. NPDC001617]